MGDSWYFVGIHLKVPMLMKLTTYIGVARYVIWCTFSSNIVPDPGGKLFLACPVYIPMEKQVIWKSP